MPNLPPWTPLHAQLHRILRDRHLLPRNQPLLVAVSGGQDSLCLIKLLLDLQPKWGWHLGIAHCDHRWRPDSQANANHVEQLARTWQVSYYLETAPETPSITSEAAARQWRYQALSAIAQTNNFPYIVTGHTASDRAETLLYNLMRGSGADGLQALTWQRPLTSTLHPTLQLVRPLLEVTRAQTAQFCQEFQIPVWEDSTNQDFKYARNRIRQELLPYLQTHFNPQVEQTLAKTAELLRADVQYLEEAAQKLLQQALENEDSPLNPEYRQGDAAPTALSTDSRRDPRLNRLVLRQAPLALQRRVMRHFLASVLPIAPSFEQIEKLTALITAPNRSQTDPFPGGAIAQVDGAWISIKN
ncbi:tRNA lysidine(34) synthetase TilS [Coleofasciculus sp. FACHB-129]|uniref:tRNA lysidine(34) synthetase TilS n=1 Tax=Cyanophyceae TaxID=3028117 RepID=UPI001684C79A|nr:tRNA lysidine(34) synthetase TilS [Coleofasciculus sp. FACHB-129]MBD1896035.1 tRNA lysidine(34) synthetase TilS [Coleofasciculus sp. FACHB-129]